MIVALDWHIVSGCLLGVSREACLCVDRGRLTFGWVIYIWISHFKVNGLLFLLITVANVARGVVVLIGRPGHSLSRHTIERDG